MNQELNLFFWHKKQNKPRDSNTEWRSIFFFFNLKISMVIKMQTLIGTSVRDEKALRYWHGSIKTTRPNEKNNWFCRKRPCSVCLSEPSQHHSDYFRVSAQQCKIFSCISRREQKRTKFPNEREIVWRRRRRWWWWWGREAETRWNGNVLFEFKKIERA